MYWITKLLDLKTRRGWNDSELAQELGVRRSQLDGVLSKHEEPSLQMKMRTLDLLGYDATRNTLLWLLPSDIARSLEQQDLARGQRTSEQRADRVIETLLTAIEAALKVHDEQELERVIVNYLRDSATPTGDANDT